MARNLLLVVFDALRFDRVGAFNSSGLTPNIDSVAQDGETFENCFACSNVTDSCLTTIMTGMYPTRHGIINHGSRISNANLEKVASTKPLAERLQQTHTTIGVNKKGNWHKRGYDTYVNPDEYRKGATISTLSAIVDSLPGPLSNRIRTTYDEMVSLTLSTLGESVQTDERLMKRKLERHYPSADTTTDTVLTLLEGTDSPWHLYAHYWDAHIPYNPTVTPPSFIREKSYDDGDITLAKAIEPIEGSRWADELRRAIGHADTIGDVKRLYDAAVWYADKEFGRVIEALKDRGEYNDTTIVLTADHGESLTEHGILFEHHGLYDVTTHVPLIIKAPGFEGCETDFVQHFDIVPTALDLLEIGYDEQEFDGNSLTTKSSGERQIDREAVFMESKHKARKRAIRTELHKFIKRLGDRTTCRFCEIPHGADRELYDLPGDPSEEDNIFEKKTEVGEALEEQLEHWVQSLPDSPRQTIDFEPPKQQLRELGYF